MVTAILLAGLSQCAVLVAFLSYKSKTHPLFTFLLAIHMVLAVDLFLLLAQQEQWIENRINACWGALYALLYFIFIRSCLGIKTSEKQWLLYFTPWIALNLSIIDFLIAPVETELVARHHMSGPILLLIYLVFTTWACVTVYRYQRKREEYLANLSEENVWLLWGICASLILAVSTIPFQYIFETSLPLPQMLISFVMFVMTYLLLLNPKLLHFESLDLVEKGELNSSDELDVELEKQIIHLLDQQRVFIDPDLNLRSFAEQLGAKPYIVSQVLNRHMNVKFYDLINRRRVKLICELMEQFPNRALFEIALEAGFNSKSTFNAAFKKYQTVTPSQFKETITAKARTSTT